MFNRDNMHLVPETTILTILGKDAQVLCDEANKAKFIESNKTEYCIAVNTWIRIIKTYSKYGWMYILDRVIKDGLAATILWCDDFAKLFVANPSGPFEAEYQLLLSIYDDVRRSYAENSFYHPVDFPQLSADQVFLTILRYLKRISPVKATELDRKALESFVETQRFLKQRDRGILAMDNLLVLNLVKDEVSKLDIDDRVRRFSEMSIWDISITSGAAYDSSPDLPSKLAAINAVCPSFFRNEEHFISAFFPIYMGRTLDHVKVQTVPKNIKTARTIAMENTYRQACAKRMFLIWQDTLPAAINLHDQTVNQQLAMEGSITGDLATIDLKSASDSVRYSLVRSLYPNEFCEYLDLVRPSIAELGPNRSISLTSWATMGNSLTFILESEIFYLICEAAVSFHERHFGVCKDRRISVYGDDLIVPTEACPTVIAFLTALGFIVNEDKTFYAGHYRESCGKEYNAGEDWSSIYFPRFPISNNLLTAHRDSREDIWSTDYSRLVTLQHRLFSVSHDAAHWLASFLLEKKPRLGVTPAGGDGSPNALWGLDTRYSATRILPLYTFVSWRQWEVYHFITINGIVQLPDRVDDTNPELLEARTRHYICVPVQVFGDIKSSKNLLDKYLYLQFLKNGPTFKDELSKLLGTSEPPMRDDPLSVSFAWRDIEA